MKRTTLFIIVVFYVFSPLFGAGELAELLGGGSVKSIHSSPLTLFYTPAVVSQPNDYNLAFNYTNGFLVEDLSYTQFMVSAGTTWGSFNGGVERFGNCNYNTNRFLLGYANKWGRLEAGVNLNFILYNIVGSQPAGMVYSQIGLKSKLTNSFKVGFSLTNVEMAKVEVQETFIPIPTVILLSGEWRFNKELAAYCEVEMDLVAQTIFKAALEWQMVPKIVARVGFMNQPISPTFGLGMNLKSFQVDAGLSYNSTLGVSSALSIQTKF